MSEPVDDPDVPFVPEPDQEPEVEVEQPEEMALEVRPAGGLGLFGTGSPAEQLYAVEQAATALKQFVVDHDLTLEMEDGTDYLTLPAWEGLGQIVGVFAKVEWTEQISGGWKARALATTRAGEVLTSREALCLRAEPGRQYKPESELHAMAQSRATRNALNAALSIIANAAGYDAAPLDERPMAPKQRAQLFVLLTRLDVLQPKGKNGWKDWTTERTLRRFGKRISGLNRAEARQVIAGMQRLLDEMEAQPAGPDDLDTAGGEVELDLNQVEV